MLTLSFSAISCLKKKQRKLLLQLFSNNLHDGQILVLVTIVYCVGGTFVDLFLKTSLKYSQSPGVVDVISFFDWYEGHFLSPYSMQRVLVLTLAVVLDLGRVVVLYVDDFTLVVGCFDDSTLVAFQTRGEIVGSVCGFILNTSLQCFNLWSQILEVVDVTSFFDWYEGHFLSPYSMQRVLVLTLAVDLYQGRRVNVLCVDDFTSVVGYVVVSKLVVGYVNVSKLVVGYVNVSKLVVGYDDVSTVVGNSSLSIISEYSIVVMSAVAVGYVTFSSLLVGDIVDSASVVGYVDISSPLVGYVEFSSSLVRHVEFSASAVSYDSTMVVEYVDVPELVVGYIGVSSLVGNSSLSVIPG